MIKTYVLNLDRHTERLEKLKEHLDQHNLQWVRFPAVDGTQVSSEYLDSLVAVKGPIPRMPIGARACTASHILILRDFIKSAATHALILEDDAELSDDLSPVLTSLIEAAPMGILNINRQPSSKNKKSLIVRKTASFSVAHFAIHDLVGIHYGTAGFVIDKISAQKVLDLYPYPDVPIDHMLFNPNISKIYGKIPVRQLFPALVRPSGKLSSSIQHEPVENSNSFKNKFKRAKAELRIVPRLIFGLLFQRYMVKVLEFK